MDELKFVAAGVLGHGVVRAIHTTCRTRLKGEEHLDRLRDAGKNWVFVIWHGTMLAPIHHHRNSGVVVLVSEHGDGEYIARVLHRMGYGTARGSSTRGGTRGLRRLLGAARDGDLVALTPDGPRGPPRVMKPGALVVAQLSGLPVIPIGVGLNRGWTFDSWDRFTIAKPFSTVALVYGPPVEVPRDMDEADLERHTALVQAGLDNVTARAEELARKDRLETEAE